MINWDDLKAGDYLIINRLCERARTKYPDVNFVDLDMDITAAHLIEPLNLDKFEAAKDFDFFHDVFGIMKYIDRASGKLTDCFLPRCSS